MDEEAFIAAVLAAPRDDAPLLEYAGWLDERGDPRGEWLRASVRLQDLLGRAAPGPMADKLLWVREVAALRRRLRALRVAVPEAWALRVQRGAIEHCGMVGLGADCPREWSRLGESDEPARRSCGHCQRWVRFCWSAADVRAALSARHPVVKWPALARAWPHPDVGPQGGTRRAGE